LIGVNKLLTVLTDKVSEEENFHFVMCWALLADKVYSPDRDKQIFKGFLFNGGARQTFLPYSFASPSA
jgi:hypothetical protein